MRIEKDFLGEAEIESNAYYGIESLRAKKNFPISNQQVHPEMLKSYLLLKKAAALANYESHLLSKVETEAITKAIDQIIAEEKIFDQIYYFIIDSYQAGAGTSQNMNINEVIANVANEICGYPLGSYGFIHPHNHVNLSQSTNDTYPTALRLATLSLSKKLLREISLCSSELDTLAKSFNHILKVGRTHLQDALPMRLGQEFSGYKSTLDKLYKLLLQAHNYLYELGIGGSAIGTGQNVPKAYPENILKHLRLLFVEPHLYLSHNLFFSMQSQLPMMIYSNALRAICLEFTRIVNDLRLMASGPATGFQEIFLPETQPGSSIMPGKINPSILEMGNQVFFKVLGNDTAMAYALQAGQLELNVMMPLMAQVSLESTMILTNALKSIRENCLKGMRANEAQCEKNAGLSVHIVTALSPLIGYTQSAELAKEARKRNKSIIDLVKEKNLLSEKQIEKYLDLKKISEVSPNSI